MLALLEYFWTEPWPTPPVGSGDPSWLGKSMSAARHYTAFIFAAGLASVVILRKFWF